MDRLKHSCAKCRQLRGPHRLLQMKSSMLELSDAELNGRRYENENCLNRIEKLVSTFLNIYMKELNVSNVD